MSQEKVDKYKQEKANRKQIMQKEKRMKVVRKCLYSVIGIALIGWLGYSGGYVLYEVSSHNIFLENLDIDGEVEDKPIANSLKELINNMNVIM